MVNQTFWGKLAEVSSRVVSNIHISNICDHMVINIKMNQTFWGKLAEVSSRVVLVQLVSVGVAMQLSEHLKHQLNFDTF